MREEVLITPAPSDNTNGRVIPQQIETHMTKAVFATFLCCFPLGLLSFSFADQVKNKLETGDIDGALKASKKANFWSNISIGYKLVVLAIGMIAWILITIKNA
jgi:hypothetical protein